MTDIDQYRLDRIDELIEKNKHLQATILAYSERVNNYELQVGDLWKTIHEQLLIKDEQKTEIEMYKIKVNRLRRTIGEYIDKYGLQ